MTRTLAGLASVSTALLFTSTAISDDLERFEDLRGGDRVEIDYVVVDGQRIAREIEKDD